MDCVFIFCPRRQKTNQKNAIVVHFLPAAEENEPKETRFIYVHFFSSAKMKPADNRLAIDWLANASIC